MLPAASGPRKLREALRLGLHAPASTRHLSLAALVAYTSVWAWAPVRTGKQHPLIFVMRAVLCALLVKGGTEVFEGSEGIRVSRCLSSRQETWDSAVVRFSVLLPPELPALPPPQPWCGSDSRTRLCPGSPPPKLTWGN